MVAVATGAILASIYNTMNERRREFAILRALADHKQAEFRGRLVGERREAVIEAESDLEGWRQATTDNYAPVSIRSELPDEVVLVVAAKQRTADEVVIPSTFQLLLDITEPLYGVHKATRELLREIHHRYAGWPQTLADLHRRAAGDFYHYNQHPEAIGQADHAKEVEDISPREEEAVQRCVQSERAEG